MTWKYNNRVIREGRSWTDDAGITHPTGWGRWSTEDKTAAGLVFVADPEPFDSRFYWDADTPKDLADLVAQKKKEIAHQAHNILKQTDWVIVRAMELSQEVPVQVSDYRSAVRQAEVDMLTMVDAASDFDSFVTLVSGAEDEPSALGAWPEIDQGATYDN